MTTSLNDLKPQVSMNSNTPSQNIIYDPNMKEVNKVVANNLKQDDMTELINNIQENNQYVNLPSVDIPRTSDHISVDGSCKPNYVPESTNNSTEIDDDFDYTQENVNVTVDNEKESTDKFILPIIVLLTTISLNTPITLKFLFKIFPKLFRKDGHPFWYYSALKGFILAFIVYYFINH